MTCAIELHAKGPSEILTEWKKAWQAYDAASRRAAEAFAAEQEEAERLRVLGERMDALASRMVEAPAQDDAELLLKLELWRLLVEADGEEACPDCAAPAGIVMSVAAALAARRAA